jgi:hypothetical protein
MSALMLGLLSLLLLAGCGQREHIPVDAAHPMIWWVGLTLGAFLLSGCAWMLTGAIDRWERRHERREGRG